VHVIVVGCGRVGSELCGALEAAGHSVAIIDKNVRATRRLPSAFRGLTVIGMGFDVDTLRDAGIERAGAVAAVTSGDNSNILIARIARETFNVERVVARIYDPRRAEIYQRLGIPTVATVAWTTDQVLRRLLPGEYQSSWLDPTGQVALAEREVPASWAGKPVSTFTEPGRFQIVAVGRFGTARVATPDLVLQDGDILHVIIETSAFDLLASRLDGTLEHQGH
jgi:trk system potassium uptake protein TrkA